VTSRSAAARPRGVSPRPQATSDAAARRRWFNPWIVLAVGVVAAFFVLIQGRLALDRSAFAIQDYDARIAAAEKEYWDLRLDVAQLQDPARIESLARDFGMVYPQERSAISVEGPQPGHAGIEDRWAELKVLLSLQP